MPSLRERSVTSSVAGTQGDVVVGGRTVLRISPEAGRFSVRLVMPNIGRSVDVTSAPGAAVHALNEAGARAGIAPSQVHAVARRIIAAAAEVAQAWQCATFDAPLICHLGGGAFPLLGDAYEHGAGAVTHIPSWIGDSLVADDPLNGARSLFGALATRAVGTSFAGSLLRCGAEPIDFSRIALGLIGATVLEPDQLARVLLAPGDAWPSSELPSPIFIATASRAASLWGTDRTLGYLLQGAQDNENRRLLVDCVGYAIDLGLHAPIRVPRDLHELADMYRLYVRTNSHGAVSPAARPNRRARNTTGARDGGANDGVPRADADDPQRPRSTRAARRGPSQRRVLTNDEYVTYGLFTPPRIDESIRVAPQTVLVHPPWLRVVDGTSCEGFHFVLPRICNDLNRWSRLMRNCLDRYGPATASGASYLIGVEHAGGLYYAIELNPAREIRQFSGIANRSVGAADHEVIVGHLRRLEIVA